MSEVLKTKSDIQEVKKVWANFQKYAQYEDFKDLYAKILPSIEKFEHKLEDFHADVERHNIILRRFDEIITEKANK